MKTTHRLINRRMGKSYLPLIIGLAAAIVIGLFAFTLMTGNGGNGDETTEDNGKDDPNPNEIVEPEPGPETISEDEEVTLERMKTVFEGEFDDPPPAISDKARLKEIYEVGTKSRIDGLATISGRVSKKDWGIKGFVDFTMATQNEAEVIIEENDGENITALVDFLEMQTLDFRTKYGVKVDLGSRLHRAFELGAMALRFQGVNIPPGSSKMSELLVNKILEKAGKSELIAALFEHDIIKGLMEEYGLTLIEAPEIDALRDTQFRVNYRDGTGVTKVVFIGYLNDRKPESDEKATVLLEDLKHIFQGGLFSAPHLFPSGPLEDGDLHDVSANMLPNPFPKSWNLKKSGKVSFGRYDQQDNKGEIYYRRGSFKARGGTEKKRVEVDFQPDDGAVHFQIKPQKLRSLSLKGTAEFDKKSTGHYLFEARHQVTPKFEITTKVQELEN